MIFHLTATFSMLLSTVWTLLTVFTLRSCKLPLEPLNVFVVDFVQPLLAEYRQQISLPCGGRRVSTGQQWHCR
jgi:hypothetical protein